MVDWVPRDLVERWITTRMQSEASRECLLMGTTIVGQTSLTVVNHYTWHDYGDLAGKLIRTHLRGEASSRRLLMGKNKRSPQRLQFVLTNARHGSVCVAQSA